VRDLTLNDPLEALAREAAERMRELVRSGEEVPFGLVGPGEGSPFAQYAPQTDRFVREHATLIAGLGAFRAASEAIGEASLAEPYLEQLGEPVPPGPNQRSEAAAVAFLVRLWEGCSDFSLEGDRLPRAIAELGGCAESAADGDAEVVAPLVGFHMPITKLSLGSALLVRADVVEVPDEVRRTEGSRLGAWEPQFLVVVRAPNPGVAADVGGEGSDAISPGAALNDVITTLRLFKPGGVGLGPYAWARTPGDRWRRMATGAAQPRAGEYRLTDTELGDLAAIARTVDVGSTSVAVSRAISRFEAGLERPALLEALSDYVLALRCLLDGGGSAEVGLSMRAAALCAEPSERASVRAEVERALALEESLMRGELPSSTEGTAPLEVVAAFEERLRGLLRGAASERRGADLRVAADETLLGDGLAAGEGAVDVRGATAEWGAIDPQTPPEIALDEPLEISLEEPPATPEPSPDEEETIVIEEKPALQEIESERPTEVLMGHTPHARHTTRDEKPERDQTGAPDWLSEVGGRGDTIDWPERPEALRLLDQRPAHRQAARRRVRHLFPRPEATDWQVAELQYDRRRRASA